MLFLPIIGLINTTLKAIGLGTLATAWLGNTATALPMVSIASAWHAYGFYMVIFLSAMQVIDPSLYESARIDGASMSQQFFYITIPGLYNTISTVLVMGFIAGIKGFGTVWAMTQGGPVDSTELAMVYIWRDAFQNGKMPYALAGSIIFGLVIMVVSVVLNQLRERKDIDA
jgi:raffinose/stachyose/melibiose transport system permease protein